LPPRSFAPINAASTSTRAALSEPRAQQSGISGRKTAYSAPLRARLGLRAQPAFNGSSIVFHGITVRPPEEKSCVVE
jgi:hypothetical protein